MTDAPVGVRRPCSATTPCPDQKLTASLLRAASVARFAHSLVLLHQGRVVARGAPHEVMDGPTLERVYDWPLVVTRDPAIGSPALVPLRRGRS